MSIVITGNPGVGKHTITELIADKMELAIIDINKIAKDSELFEKNGDTNDVDVEVLEKILESKISENNIIIGHLAPYVLRKNQVKIMIVLRRSPYDLIPVYENRKYGNDKIKDNIGSEILGIIANDAIDKFQEKIFQINVSGKTVVEVFEKIMSVIVNKKESEVVDWLEDAYPTNRILVIVLFIAFAIIMVKINPLAPTRDPATINTLLSNNKPAKAAAIPDRELSKEITTGISPPPIGITNPIPAARVKTKKIEK